MLSIEGSTLAAFVIYLIAVMAIGLYAWRRTRNTADYFLGGRTLSPAVSAISAGASDMSGWLLLGLPGFAYSAGLQAAWIALGLCCGVAANWLLVARRLRIYSAQLDDALTIPTYLQRRFASQSLALRVVPAFFILFFFLFYVSAGLIGGGKLFSTVFGINYQAAVGFGAFVILLYTLLGGFLAVSWTDVFQGLLMMLALVIVPAVVIADLGGYGEFTASIAARRPWVLDLVRNSEGHSLGAIAILSLLGWGLGYFGQPHILARFKAIRSERDIGTAAAIGVAWAVAGYFLAVLTGLCGLAYLEQPMPDPERVFILLTGLLFHPWVAGFLLAAILAAIMSTVDSQLLVCSAALAEDMYPSLRKANIAEKQRLWIGRCAVLLLASTATVLALDPQSRVLNVVAYAWAGLGAALGPAVLISLYWRRMNAASALAGILVGGITVIVWARLEGGIFDMYELVPGFFLSCFAILLTGLLSGPPKDEAQKNFIDLISSRK